MNAWGSSDTSGSSTTTWGTLIPASAIAVATPARIPGFDALVGMISIAPQPISGATSPRWQTGWSRSKNLRASALFRIVFTVAVTTRRSTLAARAIAVSLTSIGPANTPPSLTRSPWATISWATFSLAGYPLKYGLTFSHMPRQCTHSYAGLNRSSSEGSQRSTIVDVHNKSLMNKNYI